MHAVLVNHCDRRPEGIFINLHHWGNNY